MGNFQISDAGMQEWLATSPELDGMLHKVVEAIKGYAEATAPVGEPASDPHPGMYRDSFRTDVRVDSPARGSDRLMGFIYNDASYAAAVEYGYKGRSKDPTGSAHFTLTRAIDAAKGVL